MKKNVVKVVTLVKIPSHLSVLSYPKVGDYNNPFILSTTPCEEKDGKLYDIRTGEQVIKDENTFVWNNLTGTVFQYPDGVLVLLTRRFCDKQLFCLTITPRQIRNTMILRRAGVIEHENSI